MHLKVNTINFNSVSDLGTSYSNISYANNLNNNMERIPPYFMYNENQPYYYDNYSYPFWQNTSSSMSGGDRSYLSPNSMIPPDVSSNPPTGEFESE